ncbi:hypothetical protein [Inmirania thermothiophila]|uniref:Uncharacterized protein n=1 Tax=Inmirania thermothiophila TaxID=1750597 RepID=A0A3N1Y4J5_9GAMM|nr:hypothetical protein [Inmirania thermothiophila]ROR32207.1 hypothetical protein EDC57_1404 [Inmirania thermothiophila]
MEATKRLDATARPARCFCEVEAAALREVLRRRHLEGRSTVELLQAARNERERTLVALVALLDVEEETLRTLLAPRLRPGCDPVVCRRRVRAWLEEMLAAPAS